MGGKGGESARGRLPVDDPEGVTGQYDIDGKFINTGAVSLSYTEVLDLIGEGIINGLVSGQWTYSGQLFNTGYSGASFEAYPAPPGTNSAGWMRSVFWNETPLVDNQNKFNFPNIDLGWSYGTPNGTLISVNPQLTVTRVYGERLRGTTVSAGRTVGRGDDFVKVYRILNPNCNGVYVNIKFGQLYARNVTEDEYGDTERTEVKYQIEYKGIFADGRQENWSTPLVEKVVGKITYGYIKSTKIDFDVGDRLSNRNFLGWEIKITRLTPDSTTSVVVNQTVIDSITEIYDNKFSYPNSAMVRSKFNAEYFTQVPSRAFDVELLKVKVPANYNPRLRSYSGTWDGTFASEKQWTDNPAWCFYDLLTNNRYGLGKYIDEEDVDKWTLYKVSQYCDVLVPDGFGNVEPRFTCNTVINSREEAFKVMSDLASVCQSIAYYTAGNIGLMQDAKVDLNNEVLMSFTNANVENGNFNYTTSPQSSRASIAIVRYNDKNNFYKPAIEYVEDIEAIRKYGIRERELTAYGCTSRGQAIRYGKWVLLTENNQYESVSFAGGPECALLSPGNVVKISDKNRNFNARLAGRARFISGSIIELDSDITPYFTGILTGNIYKLSLTTPTYNYFPTVVDLTGSNQIQDINRPQVQYKYFTGINATGISGYTRIQLTSGWDFTNYAQVKNPVWVVENFSGQPFSYEPEYWKVLNINEDKKNRYEIFALKYYDDKYDAIDSGISTITYTYDPEVISCPLDNSFNITSEVIIPGSNISGLNYSVLMPPNANYDDFVIYRSVNGGSYSQLGIFNTTQGNLEEISSEGNYSYRIYPRKNNVIASCYAENNVSFFNEDQNCIKNVRPYGLFPFGIPSGFEDQNKDQHNDYPSPDVQISWNYSNLTDGCQLNEEDIFWRVTIRRPSTSFTPDPIYYYQETGILKDDNSPNVSFFFDMAKNASIVVPPAIAPYFPNGPYRNYDIVVEAHDANGNSSAGGNFNKDTRGSGLTDSLYTNPNGWDIIEINNPPLSGLFLYTGRNPTKFNYAQSFISGSTHTKQFIEGSTIKIQIITGKYPVTDINGGYVYFSGGNKLFTTGDVRNGQVPGYHLSSQGDLTEYPIDLYFNIYTPSVAADREEVSPLRFGSGYMCLSLYDSFDYNRESNGDTNWTVTGTYLSNVVFVSGFV